MASHPPALCCIQGVKHEGKPVGTLEKIGEYETYITQVPADAQTNHKETAILILPDVLGHAFPNVQLIADQFAANGYATYIPDTFDGDHIGWPGQQRPPDFDFQKWFKGEYSKSGKGHSVENVEPVVKTLIKYLRQEKEFKKIGAVGYCFGAKYVVRHLGIAAKPGESEGVDAGFVAHPSFVDEEELEKIQGPLSIASAYHDEIFPPEKRHKSEEILDKVGVPYQINLYSHVEHGYAVKGDVTKREQKFAKEKTFLQAVQWFDEYLQ